jgi:type IV secretion system protein VirB11
MLLQESKQRIKDKLRREAGEHVVGALNCDEVIEILLNPDGGLWIEYLNQSMTSVSTMHAEIAESLIATVASFWGVIIDRDNPILECEFPLDGSRFEALLPPVVEAPAFSIRKRAIRRHTLQDYLAAGAMSQGQMEILHDAIVQRRNILVVGGTGSGKTTLTNALIATMVEIAPAQRLVIIEDTREIQCSAANHVQLKTSDSKSMDSLLRATLRLRPDRIIVGEVRGAEAITLLKSWNTGHPGGIATLHANNSYAALDRLEQLIGEATSTPMGRLIAEAVDLVVVIAKVPGGRKIMEIAEVTGYDGQNYNLTMR